MSEIDKLLSSVTNKYIREGIICRLNANQKEREKMSEQTVDNNWLWQTAKIMKVYNGYTLIVGELNHHVRGKPSRLYVFKNKDELGNFVIENIHKLLGVGRVEEEK